MMNHGEAMKCCGTCKWFERIGLVGWGWCNYEIPPSALIASVPEWVDLSLDANGRDLGTDDGTNCPTYEAKP